MSQQTDYTTWQHAELIQRVQDLERQLRETTQHLSVLAEKQSHKKPPRPFNAARHSTRKIALKFAYLGAKYNGLEHHANNATRLPPVEKVLWQALVKTRLIAPQHKEGQNEGEVSWEGCEYSKCGRTDKGVSSFGQVISIRVRSARPLEKVTDEAVGDGFNGSNKQEGADMETKTGKPFDSIMDELPYISMLNRVLPSDIRVLAWCADLPPDFDARFSCRERRYRYFFTNPAFLPVPKQNDDRARWLDIDAMREAAAKYEGLHDFRNFCKIDGAKQITNFQRRIFRAQIHAMDDVPEAAFEPAPRLHYFEVRGSAFLWHQVRHLVAVLFLVGQGLEKSSVVDELLDVERTPARPTYQMASDAPLVLWDCIFPALSEAQAEDHVESASASGHNDALHWLYENDCGVLRTRGAIHHSSDRRYDRDGVLESLWTQWRGFKLQEVLAQQLMSRVADDSHAGQLAAPLSSQKRQDSHYTARVFEGGDDLRSVGPYVPMLQRKNFAEPPDVVNARYAAKKGRVQSNGVAV